MLCVACHYKYPCVYYALVRRGQRIKIGTTRDVWMRMKTIGGRLLALELGSYKLEAVRHVQLAAYQAPSDPLYTQGKGSSEHFMPHPVVMSLIDAIAARDCESCALDEEERQALEDSLAAEEQRT